MESIAGIFISLHVAVLLLLFHQSEGQSMPNVVRPIFQVCDWTCEKYCQYGYTMEGCPRCTCAKDPCALVRCPSGFECVPVTSNCGFKSGCPQNAQCKAVAIERTAADCLLPRDIGPCRALVPRFFYNSETSICEFFNYGGCRGNQNNFNSWLECSMRCPASSTADESGSKCTLPREVGPCRSLRPRFYYNSETQSCQFFNYGGCRGNENNFKTWAECSDECL